MRYFRHGDPLDDFASLDREQARREAKLPICSECGRRIYDKTAIYKDGEWTCEKCIDNFRVTVDDYLDE